MVVPGYPAGLFLAIACIRPRAFMPCGLSVWAQQAPRGPCEGVKRSGERSRALVTGVSEGPERP